MAGHQSIEDVLREARATLETAELGVEDFLHGDRPSRRAAGLRNAVVWGRTVTNVLQNIRTFRRNRFNTWYEPKQQEMRDNPRFKYLYELRSQVLKEGVLGSTAGNVAIGMAGPVTVGELLQRLGPPTANTVGQFFGDHLGGSGFEVRLADGSTEKVYRDVTNDLDLSIGANFTEATTQLGLPPPDEPIHEILHEYIDYLRKLVDEAQREFG